MFYFYHSYCHTQYNCYSKDYLILLVYFILAFFILKKVSNKSNYCIFNCFIFFFQSKNTSHIFNCSVIYFFFYAKKISYIFNYVVPIFFLFQALNLPLLYIVKKNNDFFFKIKVYYAP